MSWGRGGGTEKAQINLEENTFILILICHQTIFAWFQKILYCSLFFIYKIEKFVKSWSPLPLGRINQRRQTHKGLKRKGVSCVCLCVACFLNNSRVITNQNNPNNSTCYFCYSSEPACLGIFFWFRIYLFVYPIKKTCTNSFMDVCVYLFLYFSNKKQ